MLQIVHLLPTRKHFIPSTSIPNLTSPFPTPCSLTLHSTLSFFHRCNSNNSNNNNSNTMSSQQQTQQQQQQQQAQAEDPYVALFGHRQEIESPKNRYSKFITENPLVPAAIAGAGFSLIGGFWAYRTGRQQLSQYLQRARVGFQGLAVAALVIGTWSGAHKDKKDE